MKRKLLIALFAAGAVIGFGKGFYHLGAHHHAHRSKKVAAFKAEIVQMCVDAAVRARTDARSDARVAESRSPRSEPAPQTPAP